MGTGVEWTMNSMVHPTPVPMGPPFYALVLGCIIDLTKKTHNDKM